MLFRNLLLLGGVSLSTAQVGPWGQCGGIGYTGATTCVTGWSCQRENNWYFQCRPVPSEASSSTSIATTFISSTPSTAIPTRTTQPPTSQTSPLVTLCTQEAYYTTGEYAFINNLWGIDTATEGSQCTYYNGPVADGGVSFSTNWRWAGGQWNVKSFIYGERVFARKLVSEINSLSTIAQWSYNTTDIRANVAYDIFTDQDKDHTNMFGQYEIMIWLAQYGGVGPISEIGAPVAQVTLAGYTWNLYTGWNSAWTPPQRVYSFVTANGPINSFSADVMEFFRYLITEHSFPASSQYMLIYQLGTEPFTGGPANFHVSRFQADVK